jgi:hypothetical protein
MKIVIEVLNPFDIDQHLYEVQLNIFDNEGHLINSVGFIAFIPESEYADRIVFVKQSNSPNA